MYKNMFLLLIKLFKKGFKIHTKNKKKQKIEKERERKGRKNKRKK